MKRVNTKRYHLNPAIFHSNHDEYEIFFTCMGWHRCWKFEVLQIRLVYMKKCYKVVILFNLVIPKNVQSIGK